jgi:hypothetical protein
MLDEDNQDGCGPDTEAKGYKERQGCKECHGQECHDNE